jgi:hypothetical protein
MTPISQVNDLALLLIIIIRKRGKKKRANYIDQQCDFIVKYYIMDIGT